MDRTLGHQNPGPAQPVMLRNHHQVELATADPRILYLHGQGAPAAGAPDRQGRHGRVAAAADNEGRPGRPQIAIFGFSPTQRRDP